jgi:hypothetical protein
MPPRARKRGAKSSSPSPAYIDPQEDNDDGAPPPLDSPFALFLDDDSTEIASLL